MSTWMSCHFLLELKVQAPFEAIQRITKLVFPDSIDFGWMEVSRPKKARWIFALTPHDGSKGVTFYGDGEDFSRALKCRVWELVPSEGELRISAYSNGAEVWTEEADKEWTAPLARLARDVGVPLEDLLDRRALYDDPFETTSDGVGLNVEEDWEQALAKFLKVKRVSTKTVKTPSAKQLAAARREEDWAARRELKLKDPKRVVAAVPKAPLPISEELDRLQALWRSGDKAKARAGFKTLRIRQRADRFPIEGATCPSENIAFAERGRRKDWLPDFSFELLSALPDLRAQPRLQLLRLWALSALKQPSKFEKELRALLAARAAGKEGLDELLSDELLPLVNKTPLKSRRALRAQLDA